jgi:hypothetical protein
LLPLHACCNFTGHQHGDFTCGTCSLTCLPALFCCDNCRLPFALQDTNTGDFACPCPAATATPATTTAAAAPTAAATLQDTNTGDFKVLGDLARMVSLPVGMSSPLVAFQQHQQQQLPVGTGATAGRSSLAGGLGGQQQQQPLTGGDFGGAAAASQGMDGQAAAGVNANAAGSVQPALPGFAGAAAAAGAYPLTGGLTTGTSLPEAAPSMDSGMRSALNHLGRLQIPTPSGDMGLASLASLQGPMSVDASRPGMD